MIQATAICKDLPSEVYNRMTALDGRQVLNELIAYSHAGYKVTVKYGAGQFKERVEFNGLLKSNAKLECKTSERRGYMLVTFKFLK